MDSHGGNIYKIAKEFNYKENEIIDFSSNINLLGVPKSIKKIIKTSLNNISSYPDPDYSNLTQAISDYHNINNEKIIIGNGATELIYLFMRTLSPNKTLIVSPTFSEYRSALDQMKPEIKYFELNEKDEFAVDLDILKEELKNNYDLIVMCNPNNPTSTFIEIDKIEEIINDAIDSNTTVLIDESFIEFINNSNLKSAILIGEKYKNIFILRSLTKFFGIPGLRLGYAVSFNEDIISGMKKNQEPWTVNILADLAGNVVLKDKKYIKKTMKLTSRERDYLYDNLQHIKWIKTFKPNANFILIKILNNLISSEIKTILLKNKILVRDAANFKFLNSKFIRLAIKDRASNRMLIKQLKRID